MVTKATKCWCPSFFYEGQKKIDRDMRDILPTAEKYPFMNYTLNSCVEGNVRNYKINMFSVRWLDQKPFEMGIKSPVRVLDLENKWNIAFEDLMVTNPWIMGHWDSTSQENPKPAPNSLLLFKLYG